MVLPQPQTLGIKDVVGPCRMEGRSPGKPAGGLIRYDIKCVTENAPHAGFIKHISMLVGRAKRKKRVTSFFVWARKKLFKSVDLGEGEVDGGQEQFPALLG